MKDMPKYKPHPMPVPADVGSGYPNKVANTQTKATRGCGAATKGCGYSAKSN